jgi:hypothetical protein
MSFPTREEWARAIGWDKVCKRLADKPQVKRWIPNPSPTCLECGKHPAEVNGRCLACDALVANPTA